MQNSTKYALVTGGTDGIGKEIARGLARTGHQLIIVGRDGAKGKQAEEALRQTTENNHVWFWQADLSLVKDSGRLVEEVNRQFPALHLLVHSAGIVQGKRELTAEGVESNFATNYLSRFVLTNQLLPLLQSSGSAQQAARILLVSGAAQNGTIHFEDVNLTRNFSTLRAVWQFCAANDVFTVELARRLAARDSVPPVTVTSLKLGVVKTNIRRGFPDWMRWVVSVLLDPLLGQTPVQAAEGALRLLLSSQFEGVTGALFLKIRQFRQTAIPARLNKPQTAQKLWDLSERLASTASMAAA